MLLQPLKIRIYLLILVLRDQNRDRLTEMETTGRVISGEGRKGEKVAGNKKCNWWYKIDRGKLRIV